MTGTIRHPRTGLAGVLGAMSTVSLCAVACGAVVGGAQPAQGAVPRTSRTDAAGVVWLCRPGIAANPCTANLRTTVVSANGSTSIQPAPPATTPAFDCFYAYPTVSTQPTQNANLTVQPAETAAAMQQASRFSQVCRVWAPMYRQRTATSLAGGLGGHVVSTNIAYASLLAGWRDYLTHYNDKRPLVLIGHSQGAAMLIRLIRTQIDPNPTLRRRLVSAIILGGNVTVPDGADVGGSFKHIPTCSSATQTGCVIAYSSFPSMPPATTNFGRPGQGVSLQSGQTQTTGVHVVCVNPASLSGGTGALEPYFLTTSQQRANQGIRSRWVEYPDLYSASCQSAGGATWLQVNDVGTASDPRPRVSEPLGPTWGFHLDDVNLALGNLVTDVRSEEQAYRAASR
jgi:pimeloyl-ACP methyl ester carboxylesterase